MMKLEEILNVYESGQYEQGSLMIISYFAKKPRNAIDDFFVSVAAVKKTGNCTMWQKQMLRDFFKEIHKKDRYINLFLNMKHCEEVRDYMYLQIL